MTPAGDASLLKSDLAQDLRLMLAESRRAAVKRKGVVAHQDRTPKAGRSLRFDPHAARLELGVFEQFGDGVDRPSRHDRLLQREEKVVAFP